MAKKLHSFTENYNDCIKGLPIVQVAAYRVLQEGLLGTLGKIGAAGLGAYGLYNYGGDAANWIGQHVNQNLGDKLGDLHQNAVQGIKSSSVGQMTGLGNKDDVWASELRDQHTKDFDAKINAVAANNSLTPEARQQQINDLTQQKANATNWDNIRGEMGDIRAQSKNAQAQLAASQEAYQSSRGSSPSQPTTQPAAGNLQQETPSQNYDVSKEANISSRTGQPLQPNANNPNFDPTGSPTGGQTLDQVKMNNAMTTAGNAKNAFLEQPKTPSAQSVTQSNTNTPQQAPTPQKDVAANNTTPTPVKTPPVHVPTPSTATSVGSQVGNQLKNTAIHMGANGIVRKAASSLNSPPKPTNNGYGQGKHGQYMG